MVCLNRIAVTPFQSTLPYGSDIVATAFTSKGSIISIHAPAQAIVVSDARISIHAPSRERRCIMLVLILRRTFQSTLPHGSDFVHTIISSNRRQISIHAPSRERPRAGSSIPCRAAISIHAPSRERPTIKISRRNMTHFNPRSLTGATAQRHQIFLHFFISIHAPSRERLLKPRHRLTMGYFNPRSLAGATGEAAKERYEGIISIHAPSRERRWL